MKITTLADFENVPLGADLHEVTPTIIHSWYYGGKMPNNKGYVMLINSASVANMKGKYVGEKCPDFCFYTDYTEACTALIEAAEANLIAVKEVYGTPLIS